MTLWITIEVNLTISHSGVAFLSIVGGEVPSLKTGVLALQSVNFFVKLIKYHLLLNRQIPQKCMHFFIFFIFLKKNFFFLLKFLPINQK